MIASALTTTARRSAGARFRGSPPIRRQAGKLYAVSRLRLSLRAVDLHDRRHADAGADHRQDASSRATATRPRSSTSKASRRRRGRLLAGLRRPHPTSSTPHAILHVDEKGEIKEEIALPDELLAHEIRFGLEGITTIGEGDDLTLVDGRAARMAGRPEGPGQASRLQAEGQGMGGGALPARSRPKKAGSACPRSPRMTASSTSSSATT